MSLTKSEQELVAIGASVGAGCHPCTEYHLAEATRVGIGRDVLLQAVADAECVKRSAYNELAVRSRELLSEAAELPPSCCDDTNMTKEFVSVGSAVGANSLAQLRKHIDQARSVGIDSAKLALAVEVARNVQVHAGEYTAKEAALLTQTPSRGFAPVFLTADAGASESKDACGADCACNSAESVPAEASACCGEEAVPVVAGASAGKCC